jgi:hypothetical protein
MKKIFLLSLTAMVFCGCSHDLSNYGSQIDVSQLQDKDPNEVTQEDIQANVASIFGTIDPNQDWNLINSGSVTITADANLDNIVKVQILTEAPFYNDDARVIAETAASNGETVTLDYQAPNGAETLVAACVSDRGVYYIQVFTPGDKQVNFSAGSKARTRNVTYDLPDPNSLKLEQKNSMKSFNALRAENQYKSWNTESGALWINERLWKPTENSNTGSSWKVTNNGCIVKEIEGFTTEEEANIKEIVEKVLRKDGNNGYRNNMPTIRNSPYFTMFNNHLTSDGVTAITLIPIQMNSTEAWGNQVYYYYFNPNDVVGDTATFIKSLPKYKAIHCNDYQKAAGIKNVKNANDVKKFFRGQEYLLAYYGDGVPTDGKLADPELVFPKGYKIGFMNRKNINGNSDNYTANNNGCVYGYGKLNVEINNFDEGHFGTVLPTSKYNNQSNRKYCMEEDDPRIVFFRANDKTYLAFEDGADTNFTDMVIEVTGGTEIIDEEMDVYKLAYTMCFEDSPIADYDMNDVILKFEREDDTHVKVSLMACGAYDELYLRGLNGQKLNERTEIHAIFGVDNPQTFINTGGGETKEPVSELFEIPANSRMSEFMENIYIYDKTNDYDVTLAGKGDDPHAIVIPSDFEYPKERINIHTAYPLFNNWAANATSDRYWFRNAVEQYIYKK